MKFEWEASHNHKAKPSSDTILCRAVMIQLAHDQKAHYY